MDNATAATPFFSFSGYDGNSNCNFRTVFGVDGYHHTCDHGGSPASEEYHLPPVFSQGHPYSGQWYMVALVRDDYDIKIYSYPGATSDDGLLASGTSTLSLQYAPGYYLFLLGRDTDGQDTGAYFSGKMSFVGLFNAALSAEDLFQIWNSVSVYAATNTPPTSTLPTPSPDWLHLDPPGPPPPPPSSPLPPGVDPPPPPPPPPPSPPYNFRQQWFDGYPWDRFMDYYSANNAGNDYADYHFYNNPSPFADYFYSNHPSEERWTSPRGIAGRGDWGPRFSDDWNDGALAPAQAPEGAPELPPAPMPTIRSCCRANTLLANDDDSWSSCRSISVSTAR